MLYLCCLFTDKLGLDTYRLQNTTFDSSFDIAESSSSTSSSDTSTLSFQGCFHYVYTYICVCYNYFALLCDCKCCLLFYNLTSLTLKVASILNIIFLQSKFNREFLSNQNTMTVGG